MPRNVENYYRLQEVERGTQMKIPKATKLPSGRYRVQVQVNGRRVGETFDTPEEAQYWAAGIKTRMKDANKPARRVTVAEAVDLYLERRSAVLSPATIAGYRRIQKNLFPSRKDQRPPAAFAVSISQSPYKSCWPPRRTRQIISLN